MGTRRPPPPWKVVEQRERAALRAALPPFECPACGRGFENAQGLKIHRGRLGKHGASTIVPASVRRSERRRVPPKDRREQCAASQLRRDDWLVTGEGPLRLVDVEQRGNDTGLLSNGAWWSVPSSTRFVRIRQSRRIEMRPDLRPKEEQ